MNWTPHGRARRCIAGVSIAIALAAEAVDAEDLSKLRFRSEELSRVAVEAHIRSAAFRALVSSVADSDVLVYVEFGRCAGEARACLLFVCATPGARYMRIRLDRFQNTPFDLAPFLAHELQHAVEVSRAREVVSQSAFLEFFAMNGHRISHGFETATALRVQRAVAQELGVLTEPAYRR